MTRFICIHVPYSEQNIAADLGARRDFCSDGKWRTFCTATQFRSKLFKRWRTEEGQKRIVVYPDVAEAGSAKANHLSWDPNRFHWYLLSTADDPRTEMNAWVLARLKQAPAMAFQIPFELKELAKRHKLQWRASDKLWIGRFHRGAPQELLRFVKDTL